MIWFIAAGTILGLFAYGIFRSIVRQVVITSYTAGWSEAMALRDTWDKARMTDAKCDNMLKWQASHKGLHLVN